MNFSRRTLFVFFALIFQFAVLLFMAGERETILRKGRVIYCRTAPIDPRHPFRGDYIRLDYEISHVHTNFLRGKLAELKAKNQLEKGKKVYAVMRTEGDIASLDYLTDEKPAGQLFLKGRIESVYYYKTPIVNVSYGIEAFYVEQNKGRELERTRIREDAQIPLEMAVAVARNGTTVLKGYRWSKLGVGLKLETVTTNLSNTTQRVTLTKSAEFILMNASKENIGVINNMACVSLEQDTLRVWENNPWQWVGKDTTEQFIPSDPDVKILKPGEEIRIKIDLADPQWFVNKEGEKPRTITGISDWNARFRVIYRAPSIEKCSSLKNASLIWHGYMMSRAFNGGGRID